MPQRKSLARAMRLERRRVEQFARGLRAKERGKPGQPGYRDQLFFPVFTSGLRHKAPMPNCKIIFLGGKRFHATKGARPLTAYERSEGCKL